MATTTDSTHRGSRRRSFWRYLTLFVFFVAGALALVILIVSSWLAIRDARAHSQLQQEVERLKTAGLPYDDASLAEYYAQLSSPENVDRWQEILAVVDSPEFATPAQEFGPWKESGQRIPFAGEPWPAEAETLLFLDQWADLRSDAEQLALQDRTVRFPIEFDSVDTQLPEINQLREVARLIKLHGQVAIRSKESAATRDAILSIFGCARAMEGQPFLVSQVVRASLENTAMDELRCAVQANVLDTEDLERIQARIEKRISLEKVWQISINGERASGLPLFTDPKKYADYLEEDHVPVPPWRSRDALAFLKEIEEDLAVPTQDLHDFDVATQEVVKQSAQLDATLLGWFDTMMTQVVSPPVGALATIFAENELFARRAILGIGIRLYEDEHGTLPESLSQLSELGIDASKLTQIDGKPFEYRRNEDGAVLWGVITQIESSDAAQEDSPAEPAATEYPSTDPTDLWSRNSVWHFPPSR